MPTHTAEITIAPDHPAFPGHFPGNPLVPGVLILDRVIEEAERWLRRTVRVRALPQAKFSAPLLPGERARLDLTLEDATLRFAVRRGDDAIAQGTFTLVENAA